MLCHREPSHPLETCPTNYVRPLLSALFSSTVPHCAHDLVQDIAKLGNNLRATVE